MRLIDADALETDLVRRWNTNDDTDFANKEVWKALEEAPTIDAVPVVRCKDCKWRNWETNGCDRNPCVEPWFENDFCSYGERKDNE